MTIADKNSDSGSRILKAIQAAAISPQDAQAVVDQYVKRAKKRFPKIDDNAIRIAVAKKIVERYSKFAALSGGITALAGVLPGIGTVVAMVGGGLADASISMKIQVDMTMCLATNFEWDLNNEDAKHLSFLIAAGGSLEKLGSGFSSQLATKAGVSMLRQYLKGAALQTIKQMFSKIGIIFTRKALEKALPFGVGVAVSSSTNYALTRYVGNTATKWFMIDHDVGHGSV